MSEDITYSIDYLTRMIARTPDYGLRLITSVDQDYKGEGFSTSRSLRLFEFECNTRFPEIGITSLYLVISARSHHRQYEIALSCNKDTRVESLHLSRRDERQAIEWFFGLVDSSHQSWIDSVTGFYANAEVSA